MSTNDPQDLSSLAIPILEAWSDDLKWNLFDASGGAQWVSNIPSDSNLINEETTRRLLTGVLPGRALLDRLNDTTGGSFHAGIEKLKSKTTDENGNANLLLLAQLFKINPVLQQDVVDRGLLARIAHPVDAVLELQEDGQFEAAVDWLAGTSDHDVLNRLRADQQNNHSLLWVDFDEIGCFTKPFVMPLYPADSDSKLEGQWVCIAGVNGAGKSTILQGIALALLGTDHALELGTNRLAGLCSLGATSGSVTLQTSRGSRSFIVHASQGTQGTHLTGNGRTWRTLVAYGAGRNLSDTPSSSSGSMGPRARRVVTLFDPLASVAFGDLLGGRGGLPDAAVRLLKEAATAILGMTLAFEPVSDGQRLSNAYVSHHKTDPARLPDGFRSTLSWLGDLCIAWCADHPEITEPTTDQVDAIVLLDEIDLHLHARLQRAMVPRLREAFPKVSWIVTTHSPLILASFDASELRILDDQEPTGLRVVDRPVLAFSSDEIYRYVFQTEPHSEEWTRQASSPTPSLDLAVALAAAPDKDEVAARADVADLKARLERFLAR